jgi:mitotic-spindle organizing protein 1
MSNLLETGLDKETLAICIRLIETGINPTTLAHVILELKKEANKFSNNE